MTGSHNVIKTIIKAGIIAAYIGLIVVLILQALTPGKESSAISNSVGDKINQVATGINKPEADIIGVSGVEISSVTVSGKKYKKDNIYITLGSSGRINSTITPSDATNKALSYISSDSSVVYVSSDGRITAKGLGTATVSIASAENPELCDSVTITIIEIPLESVEIDNLPKELEVGQKHRLELDLSPANTSQKTFTWKSSDKSVLTVDKSGVITAKGVGVATITATSTANGEIAASVEIEVLPKSETPVIPVESVSISGGKAEGCIGDTIKLSAKITPADAKANLVWNSSDDSVATVSQKGVVSLLKAGEVTITLLCGDNISDSITITVKEKLSDTISLEFKSISATDNGYEIKQGKSGRVIAKLDEDATVLDINYSSSDESVAKIGSDGSIEAISGGVTTITVSTSYDGKTTEASFELRVDPITLKDTMENFYYTIRKSIGHFGAFLVLGILGALTYYIIFPKSFKGKLISVIVCIAAGFAVAGITEILQLPYFTEGRYCSFDDVLLDFSGYCTAAIPIGLIIIIGHFVTKIFKKKEA